MSPRRKNPLCDPTELTENLRRMEAAVAHIASFEGGEDAAPEHILAAIAAARYGFWQSALTWVPVGYVTLVARCRALIVYQAILQQYDLPPKLRKQVEAAARFFSKSRGPRLRALTESSAKQTYLSWVAKYRDLLAVAKEAIRVGKPHDVCAEGDAKRELRAGPFRLINTGGFDMPTMKYVQRVVEDAAKKMRAKGLSGVLYGDISVSNTVYKGNVLAFYYAKMDEMFVRANMKGLEQHALHMVIHELGHRLDHKFVKDAAAVGELYRAMKREERDAVYDRRLLALDANPSVGERIVIRSKAVYEVFRVDPVHGKVHVRMVGQKTPSGVDPVTNGPTGSMSLEGFLLARGTPLPKAPKGFITAYAKKSPSENFAEMVAFWCMDQLPPHQAAMLQKIIPPAASIPPEDAARASIPPPVPGEDPQAYADMLRNRMGGDDARAFALARAEAEPDDPFWVEVVALLLDDDPKPMRARSSRRKNPFDMSDFGFEEEAAPAAIDPARARLAELEKQLGATASIVDPTPFFRAEPPVDRLWILEQPGAKGTAQRFVHAYVWTDEGKPEAFAKRVRSALRARRDTPSHLPLLHDWTLWVGSPKGLYASPGRVVAR